MRLLRTGLRWSSYGAIACGLLALAPMLELLRRTHYLPEWSIRLSLVAALGFLAVLLLRATPAYREAMVDALTGTLARRALMQDLERFVRRGDPFGVLFIDVDGLKKVNDTYGHSAGDSHLQFVAECIRTVVRPVDRVYRYGGDEFVVLLPGAKGQSTRTVSERVALCAGVGTLSVGLASFPADGLNADTVLKVADSHMYRSRALRRLAAKAGGRTQPAQLPPPAEPAEVVAVQPPTTQQENPPPGALDQYAQTVAAVCRLWMEEGTKQSS